MRSRTGELERQLEAAFRADTGEGLISIVAKAAEDS